VRNADNLKSGNLNILEPSGPLQACNGTAFTATRTLGGEAANRAGPLNLELASKRLSKKKVCYFGRENI